jgi:hypothetical protein
MLAPFVTDYFQTTPPAVLAGLFNFARYPPL